MRHGRQEIGPRKLHQALDLSLVIALARSTEAILEQVMADQFGERSRAQALAVAQNPGHRDLGVVVENRDWNAAEKSERRDMAVQKGLRRLRRIGLDETGVRMRQVEAEDVQLHPHAADDADALAEVDLSVSRRMGQRHINLARPCPRQPHIVLHDGIAPGVAVFGPKAFENPLRRMTLLGRSHLVALQDRVDHRDQRPELRPLRRPGSNIARRCRISAHLGDRIPAEPKHPSRFSPAVPFVENKPPNRRVNLHNEHFRPLPPKSKFEKDQPQSWPGFTPPRSRTMPPLRGVKCRPPQ